MPKNKGSNKKTSPSKKRKGNSQSSAARVYVGGLTHEATIESVKEYAGNGATFVRWLNHSNGSFKGSAFVDFSSKKAAEKFVNKNGEKFNGNELKIAIASLKTNKARAIKNFDVHVSGFPKDSDKLMKKFVGANVTVNKITFLTNNNDEFKGTAFVQFKNAKDADAFMKKNGDKFQGNVVSLAYGVRNVPSCMVTNLPKGYNVDKVKAFVGNQKAVKAVRWKKGKNGDYCFVDFKTIAACNAFLAKSGQKDIAVLPARGVDPNSKKTVFIASLPDMTQKGTGKKLREFLEKFGEILYLNINTEKNIAFCTYSSHEEYKECLKNGGSNFLGKKIWIKMKTTGKSGPRGQRRQQGSL